MRPGSTGPPPVLRERPGERLCAVPGRVPQEPPQDPVLPERISPYRRPPVRGGTVPRDAIYFLLDGNLRRGLALRGELRFARTSESEAVGGTQVRQLLGLRTSPTRELRLEATWWRDTMPEFRIPSESDSLLGVLYPEQINEEWQFLASFAPTGASI